MLTAANTFIKHTYFSTYIITCMTNKHKSPPIHIIFQSSKVQNFNQTNINNAKMMKLIIPQTLSFPYAINGDEKI